MSRSLTVIIFCMTALAAFGDADARERRNPHTLDEDDCVMCHVDSDDAPSKLRKPVTQLCRGCHSKTVRSNSHHVDIAPNGMIVPEGLPLQDGNITCITCHLHHGKTSGSDNAGDSLLRREPSGALVSCESCHRENTIRAGHKDSLSFAHLATKYKTQGQNGSPDSLSRICMDCHNGSIGKDASYAYISNTASMPKVKTFDHGASHPIGVQYKASRESNKRLAPTHQIHRNIRLFNGKIGCGTCHDAYSSERNMLVMSNMGSKLCLECHTL